MIDIFDIMLFRGAPIMAVPVSTVSRKTGTTRTHETIEQKEGVHACQLKFFHPPLNLFVC